MNIRTLVHTLVKYHWVLIKLAMFHNKKMETLYMKYLLIFLSMKKNVEKNHKRDNFFIIFHKFLMQIMK